MPNLAEKDRFWGVIEVISEKIEDIVSFLKREEYDTRTLGKRTLEAARLVGQGVYAIVQNFSKTNLIYVLETPTAIGPVQKELNVEAQASYVFAVKNPQAENPSPTIGLPRNDKVVYPEDLQARFNNRKWSAAVPEMLNFTGVEVLLVGSSNDIIAEFGETGEEIETIAEEETGAEPFDINHLLSELHTSQTEISCSSIVSGNWE